jgi:hypothetical protein
VVCVCVCVCCPCVEDVVLWCCVVWDGVVWHLLVVLMQVCSAK